MALQIFFHNMYIETPAKMAYNSSHFASGPGTTRDQLAMAIKEFFRVDQPGKPD